MGFQSGTPFYLVNSSMAKANYPTYADLVLFFAEIGVQIPAQSWVEDLLEGIQEEMRDFLGYDLLNSTAPDTKSYDYPKNSGILVTNEPWSAITSVTLSGNLLTLNQDYWIDDERTLRFRIGPAYYPLPKSLTITGTIGYTTVPTQIWRAMLDYAAYQIIFANPQRMYTEMVQADVRIKLGTPRDSQSEFYEKLARYRY